MRGLAVDEPQRTSSASTHFRSILVKKVRSVESETKQSFQSGGQDGTGTMNTIESAWPSFLENPDVAIWRKFVAKLVLSQAFDLSMGLVIFINVAFVIAETDKGAPCAADGASSKPCEDSTLMTASHVFLGIYTLEAIIRFYVFRLLFFTNPWNMLDLFVVVTGYMDSIMHLADADDMPGPSLSLLRVFRVLRILRAARLVKKIPALYSMLRGFVGAMASMFWGFVMILFLLMIFAILSVEVVHPISLRVHADDDYCIDAFASVWQCMVLFFQILVAGDSWGACTLPVIRDQPWTFMLFAAGNVSVQLGFMNLILTFIVERAQDAKEEDLEEFMRERQQSEKKSAERLKRIFTTIDADASGTISLKELLKGYEENLEMHQTFNKLDLDATDLTALFELMDEESRGELQYSHLVESLQTIAMGDSRKHLSMLRLQISEIAGLVKKMHFETRNLSGQMADIEHSRTSNPSLYHGLTTKDLGVPQQLPKVSTCDSVNDVNDDAADNDLLASNQDKLKGVNIPPYLDLNTSDQDFRTWLQKQLQEQHEEVQLSMSRLDTKLTKSLSRMGALQGCVRI